MISPCLLNVALHGLEEAAGVRYMASGQAMRGSPVVARYADDLVAVCHSQRQAGQVRAKLAEWLAPGGLAFNEDKTRIVRLNDGLDFPGFNVRRYNGKLLIKPGRAAIERMRKRLAAEFRALRGASVAAVLAAVVPVTRGWALYYRCVVSKEVFTAMDNHTRKLTYKWACFTHPDKPKRWIIPRYYGMFSTARHDRRVFGDRGSGAHLPKMAWTKIVRHIMVTGTASPDDPALSEYRARRRRGSKPPLGGPVLRLLQAQRGRCPLCGDYLLHADREPASPREREQWLTATRKAITRQNLAASGTGPAPDETRLVHASCHRRAAGTDRDPALLHS